MSARFEFLTNDATQQTAGNLLQGIGRLSPGVADLITGPHRPAALPALVPGPPRLPDELRVAIDELTLSSTSSSEDVVATRAGLFQIHGDLERSHELAQSIEGWGQHANGDYWHAIMHRREPDYGNSKYWFRRVGQHPIFAQLADEATEILGGNSGLEFANWQVRLCNSGWDAMAFVDLCQQSARDESAPLARTATEIQFIEMLLLLKATVADATGLMD